MSFDRSPASSCIKTNELFLMWKSIDFIYIYIYSEEVDLGESDKIIKVIGKMNKLDTFKGVSTDISLFIQEFLQTKHFLIISAYGEIRKILEKIKV